MKVELLNLKQSLECVLWCDLTVYMYIGYDRFTLTQELAGMITFDGFNVEHYKLNPDESEYTFKGVTKFKSIKDLLSYVYNCSDDSADIELEITS